MQFNTPEYLVFYLGAVTAAWMLIGFPRARTWVLLIASYYFYASNNGWLTLLIIITSQFDYVAALFIARISSKTVKRVWLTLSLSANLCILGYFKYVNFFCSTAVELASLLGIKLGWVEINVLLPIGISFYTFEAMSYVIDVYRGEREPETKWYRYAFFIVYFPHLIAGPIVRAGQFLPQVDQRPRLDAATCEEAVARVVRGLFKKIVLADSVAVVADRVFSSPGNVDTVTAWIGVYAFTFQIYFDFSGYTDIAIGSARLMGFKLPENFRRPYTARSVTEFWRRWHMTLSLWIRDYIYFPLGGSRTKSQIATSRNLLVTMAIAGLWHGASWHFIFWGVLHGICLAIERAFGLAGREDGDRADKLFSSSYLLRRFVVFHLIALLWVFFRAGTIEAALTLLGRCLVWRAPDSVPLGAAMVLAVGLGNLVAQYASERGLTARLPRMNIIGRATTYGAAIVVLVIFSSAAPPPFIYFRF